MSNTIYLIVGESGCGKTTIVNKLEQLYGYKVIPSYTTRPPRYPNEKGHIFVSKEQFLQLKNICAYTEFDDYQYGATSEQVETHDLYVIDPNGIDYFKKHYKGNKQIKVIYIKVSEVDRYLRMFNRYFKDNKENISDIKERSYKAIDSSLKRIEYDRETFKDAEKMADTTICNDDLGQAVIDIDTYMQGELNE